MRKHWIDNLRWTTVLLVLLYHVVYFYNNKGVFGGVGGFGTGPQYQDTLMYLLYPWFMPLLFLLAGISARYALERQSAGAWFRSRTRKLLVPSTIGLLVLHWMTGYFNTHLAGADVMAAVPQPAKYLLWAVSGIGPLWFIQLLWLLCLVLLLFRAIGSWFPSPASSPTPLDPSNPKTLVFSTIGLVMLGVLFWLGEQTLIFNPRPESLDGLYNLYKPLFYLVPFLLGYFVFSHDGVQQTLGKAWIPLMAVAIASGAALTVTTFGQDNTTPQYLASPLNNLYGWLMCLAMMSWFKACFDRTGRFAAYMTRSSFGFYVVHYLVVASLGFMMKRYTDLPPVAIYIILTVAVFTLSPMLYEVLRRIPAIRWCLFGERKSK